MPANTPKGLPYPLPTEPVAEGAQAIRNLAEAVDARILRAAYIQRTTTLVVNQPETGPADVFSSGLSLTGDGATVYVFEFYAQALLPAATAGQNLSVNLWGDGVDLGRLAAVINSAAGAGGATVFAQRELTPTAAAHSYGIRAWGNGQIIASGGGAGQAMPAFFRIRRAA